jgi:hypothetical protein
MATVHDHESRIAQLEAELAKATARAEAAEKELAAEIEAGYQARYEEMDAILMEIYHEANMRFRCDRKIFICFEESVVATYMPNVAAWLQKMEARNG